MTTSALFSQNEVLTRCGFVALIGRPNAGKSTLLNALLGQKLSIVSAKAQTTRSRVTGILTEGSSQIVFLDTPGVLTPRDLLHRAMIETIDEAIREADVVTLVLDTTHRYAEEELARVQGLLAASAQPVVVVLSKADQEAAPGQDLMTWAREHLGQEAVAVSAVGGQGMEPLRSAIERALPEGPFLYPEDDISAENVRFFASELVRETIFEEYRDEIPYACTVVIEAFREQQEPTYIHAVVFVERNSQKGILVGEGGRSIRTLGQRARIKIEEFIGRPVYLDLWVKVLPGWRRKRDLLDRFGFRVPKDHERSTQ